MVILGIDTSCDDTCLSVIKVKSQKAGYPPSGCKSFDVFSNVVSSQVKLHAKYGGVYPFLAKREHQKNLPIVFKKATKGTDISKIDLIGVTVGPGLEPCLWQGVNFAKELAEKLKKPLFPVNHIEAHILANFIDANFPKTFPAICLVVSGGHTQLILMQEIGKYKLIGETRDDAAGECFDKVARILGLGYPGGPAIAAEAARCKVKGLRFKVRLPRPMIYQKNYDFSFSGLKTAVLYDFRNRGPKVRKSKKYIQEMCFETQQAIIDVLIHKTKKAAKDYYQPIALLSRPKKVKAIILGGGVAANDELRRQFKSKFKIFVPPKIFCTDNAAMVAITAYFHRKNGIMDWQKIGVNANLKI